jgi:hypothetical protein
MGAHGLGCPPSVKTQLVVCRDKDAAWSVYNFIYLFISEIFIIYFLYQLLYSIIYSFYVVCGDYLIVHHFQASWHEGWKPTSGKSDMG